MTASTDPRSLRYCFPPNPNPRKPSYALPPGAVDTHFHIFGPPEIFPWAPAEQRVYTPPAAPFGHYRKLAEHLGLTRGVVVQPMAHGMDNSATLDAIARSEGRFMGVAKADERTSERDFEALHAGGIRGVRFNLHVDAGGSTDRKVMETVIDRVRHLGWSVTFHTRARDLDGETDWFARIPLPVIIDHFGRVPFGDGIDQPAFRNLLALVRNHEHIYVKISCIERCSAEGSPYDDSIPFAHALLEAAPDRLLWGTDWPHSQRFEIGQQCDTGELVDMIPALIPDESLRHAILVENPLKLFPFDA